MSELGKNSIVFSFVPVNSIVVLPLMAKSYRKYKNGNLKLEKLRNRAIVLTVILLILLIIECSYFKDIQNSVIDMIRNSKKNENGEQVVVLEKDQIDPGLDLNEIAIDGITYNGLENEIMNNVVETNEYNDYGEVIY